MGRSSKLANGVARHLQGVKDLEDRCKEFLLLNKSTFNLSHIARQTTWNVSHLRKWLNGERRIPVNNLRQMLQIMSKHGLEVEISEIDKINVVVVLTILNKLDSKKPVSHEYNKMVCRGMAGMISGMSAEAKTDLVNEANEYAVEVIIEHMSEHFEFVKELAPYLKDKWNITDLFYTDI